MTTVTADNKLVSELSACDSVVEVRNADGAIIGFFAPISLEHAEQYASVAAKAYSAGINRATKTTSEVLADLESLEKTK
jgi:hypothetical protein